MIILKNVTKVYKNGTEALKKINMAIPKGEFAFIIGPSGSGKSTLVKLIMREEIATYGEIYVNGFDMQGIDRYQIPTFRRSIGVVFQDFKLLPNKTAYDNVEFALQITGTHKRDISKMVPQLLDVVGLKHKDKAYPDELSGGEQQRVALARAIANNPDLLICDEPTGNLDPKTSIGIIELLGRINKMGTTIIVATHDSNIVNFMQKRVIVLKDGRIINDKMRGQYI
ncbi:MAG: cell division ATP-binding protein FtsE [Clostridia bacterium]|nr:cell division ATP-binding protein FtsE [Clostridia bacterium]